MADELPSRADVVVVGAGIVGLAHALHAARRGLSVLVVERDERPVGASVRNFGHVGVTGQTGQARRFALASRTFWLQLRREAGLAVRDTGTVVVARAEDELAVLRELAAGLGDDVGLLTREGVRERTGGVVGALGGALLRRDLQLDPRTTVPQLAAWLQRSGVAIAWGTAAHVLEPGRVLTSHGAVRTRASVLAVGHDVDRHYPDLAHRAGLHRCTLHMLRVAPPAGTRLRAPLLTGLSLLRYPAFRCQPSAGAVLARLGEQLPEALRAQVNLMMTQQPDGDLIIGDTHDGAVTPAPFRPEALDRLLLDLTEDLLGGAVTAVRQRWRGVYARAPEREFLVEDPAEGVRVVSVTTGIGMTTALGLAEAVIGELFP